MKSKKQALNTPNPLCKLSRATLFVNESSTEADAGIDLGGGVTQLPIEDEDIIEIEEEEEVDEEEVEEEEEEEEEEEKEVHFTSTWKAFLGVIAGEARGQQEGLQYGGGSSGMVGSSVAQMERYGVIWDGLQEDVRSTWVIVFNA